MTDKNIKDVVAKAAEKARENRKIYEGIGEEFEKEFPNHEGPIFGPRNDMKKARCIKEIKE